MQLYTQRICKHDHLGRVQPHCLSPAYSKVCELMLVISADRSCDFCYSTVVKCILLFSTELNGDSKEQTRTQTHSGNVTGQRFSLAAIWIFECDTSLNNTRTEKQLLGVTRGRFLNSSFQRRAAPASNSAETLIVIREDTVFLPFWVILVGWAGRTKTWLLTQPDDITLHTRVHGDAVFVLTHGAGTSSDASS